MCPGIRLSKVLSPLEKDPLCSFWECNPGLILKLNEYKIVHFLIYIRDVIKILKSRIARPLSFYEALLGVLGIRDNRKNNYGDKG